MNQPRRQVDMRQRRQLRLVDEAAPPTPETLLTRAAEGDRDAFAALYDELSAAVYGVARRLVRDPELAEDVAQEVFVDVWRRASKFDGNLGSARTWVLTIAHRRAVDLIRSRESAKDRELRVATHETPEAGPESQLIDADERDGVRHCLDALTPIQRESVTLAYYGGLTYPQVAEQLDKPLPTIKTRMRDGLIRLRDCLEARDAI